MAVPDGGRTKRRRRSESERTHAAILETATRVASMEGIHGLTIGRLAERLGVSKSGLYSHFGSKEQLQIETIETAQAIVEREVVTPALEVPEGMSRLRALCESYVSYVERLVFPGGCFFAGLLAEVDSQPGRLHDLAVSNQRGWLNLLAGEARKAQARGEIDPTIDVEQLAFELDACLELANYHFVLFNDPEMLRRGRKGVSSILERARGDLNQPSAV